MDEKSTNRMLALTVFLSSSVAAALLGVLSYTFVMGHLPLGLGSVAEDIQRKDDLAIAKEKAEKAKVQAPSEGEGLAMRVDEEYLATFAAELKKEKEKIAADRLAVDEQQKSANQIIEHARLIQADVEAKEKQVEDLLKKVDAKEKANIADMQKLIAGMNIADATNMLLSLDDMVAARILYLMNKKVAAQIVSEAMKDTKVKGPQIRKLTMKMQSLSDDLKGDAPK